MRRFLPVLFVLLFTVARAQSDYENRVSNYIAQYKSVAIEEMQRAHIPASITLAQGILESDAGQSPLASDANNHFGIKCHDTWQGETYTYDDDKKDECFRKYKSAGESYKDHSDFLVQRSRYAFLFKYDVTDYKNWAFGLKKAGYATNPHYAQLLIKNIEKYKLYEYDMPVQENPIQPDTNKTIIASTVKDSSTYLPKADDIGSRIVYINKSRAVKLIQGESLEQLGKRFDVGLRRILKYNDWDKTHKEPGGTIVFLQPKHRGGDSLYHVVKNNETMWQISQQHGVQLNGLLQKNKMDSGEEPENGEVVYLQDTRPTEIKLRKEKEAPVAEKQPQGDSSQITIPEDYKYYTVKSGDTLFSIAKSYKLKLERLKEMNKLYSDVISVGMRLKVQD